MISRTCLPIGWIQTELSEFSDIVLGQSPPSSTYNESGLGLPFYQGKAEFGNIHPVPQKWCSSPKKIADPDSVLISVRAPVGPTNICRGESCIGRGLAAVHGLEDIPSLFILYLIRANEDVLAGKGTGTTFNAISGDILRRFPVLLPPLSEQHRIVVKIDELLTKLDAGVKLLKTARAHLKRYRQSVLKAAASGELTQQWREAHQGELEPASELLARVLKERRAKWEAEQLKKMKAAGKVPKNDEWKRKYKEPTKPNAEQLPGLPRGWLWATWEQVGFSQNGRLFPSNEYQTTGIKLLRPGNLHISGRVVWSSTNTRHMPQRWAREFPEFIVKGEELIMNLTAQSLKDEFLGRVCLTSADEHCLLNQRIARLTPIRVSRKYLLCVFKSEVFRRFVNTLNTGSLIQHMFTSQLGGFALPLPSLREQEQIVDEVERALSIADAMGQNIEQTLQQAERMRQSILKQAFEGKLVPQDPNDEPAELLLERIKIERAKREAEKSSESKPNRRRFTKKQNKHQGMAA